MASTYDTSEKCEPGEYVTLGNGRQVLIRPICRSDGQLEKDLIEGLSPETRRDRFIGGSCKASAKLIELLTDNGQRHEAFIAIVSHNGKERAIAVSHYALDEDGRAAECAVVVSDDWQGLGLGRLMLQRLIDKAREYGLERIYSIESADNMRVKRFAGEMGFECKADPRDYTLLTYTLHLQQIPVEKQYNTERQPAYAR
ncbi:GNAT family N-acetyltransferase [Microbulbifer thermotolerans]|uniref:GNAT family N-acetyltransferase n=1 Tax=Microbulbifer thermotolerans TaxID=252514 RepID=UPI00224B41F3|nr:GNAT family N-acetyltransferase [Microbulbifer thermotolerans]MCX2781104.1 GNAT family N-acetyltransferase [Microbulbifer thermotolerans]MCX2804466.1 GNAT family N-acetyltransferase [Microbulbifer thermotolerans]